MPSTPYGVPYPAATDLVQNGAANMQAIAEQLDTRVLAGRIDWGPAGAPDTSLRRTGPNEITTGTIIPSYIACGADVVANNGTINQIALYGTGTIYFSNLYDTTLYRSGANALQTNATLNVLKDSGIANTSALGLRFNGVTGAMLVQCGAPDSGGSGYRMLRVTNAGALVFDEPEAKPAPE